MDRPKKTPASAAPAAEERRKQQRLLHSCLGTLRHYFGEVHEWMGGVDDPRDPRSTTYTLPGLLLAGILLFVGHLGSRHQFHDKVRGNRASRDKFGSLLGVEQVPPGDTLNEAFKPLEPAQVQEGACRMVETLIRRKGL